MKKFIIFMFLFFTTTIITAQVLGTSEATSGMSVKLSEVMDVTVTSGAAVSFDFNTVSKIDNGIETLNAVTLTYKSNQPWFINIHANSASFTGTSDTPMPASVVQFRLNGTSVYKILSTTPTSLSGTSAAKNARGKATIGVDYKVNPGYMYTPATDYGMSIIYTISNL